MKVDNLTEQAIAAIKKAIVMGELKLGESISEIGICKKYNLSKTPVREALAILNHDELVNKVARRGSFVFDISLNEIEELAELRYLLEEFAVKKSLKLNKIAFKNDLNNVYKEMEASFNEQNYLKFIDIDTQFHKTFFKYSENECLFRNYEKISSKIETLRFYVASKTISDTKTQVSHKKILDAINEDNMELVSKNLNEHFIAWLNKYKSNFKISL